MNAQTPVTASNAFLLVGIHEAGETPHAALPGSPGGQLGLFDGGPVASDAGGVVWLAFTGDHDEADAARRFEEKYGQPPARVFDGLGGLLLCGPVPSEVRS